MAIFLVRKPVMINQVLRQPGETLELSGGDAEAFVAQGKLRQLSRPAEKPKPPQPSTNEALKPAMSSTQELADSQKKSAPKSTKKKSESK